MSHPLKNLEEEVKIDIRLIWKALFLSLYCSPEISKFYFDFNCFNIASISGCSVLV